jgi:eukaryotic-like serine/threonine-protein kinase
LCIGLLFLDMGEPEEALAATEKGRAIRQALADANPRVAAFQRDLAISLSGIGQLRQDEGHVAEAAQAYRKALAILERLPTLPAYDHYNVAITHSRLAGLGPRPGSGLSAAEGQAEANQAMTWLRTAVDRGFRQLAAMRAAPELNPLRSRPDFQLLLMDLAMPEKPFAQ